MQYFMHGFFYTYKPLIHVFIIIIFINIFTTLYYQHYFRIKTIRLKYIQYVIAKRIPKSNFWSFSVNCDF